MLTILHFYCSYGNLLVGPFSEAGEEGGGVFFAHRGSLEGFVVDGGGDFGLDVKIQSTHGFPSRGHAGYVPAMLL